jgi:hypothetical protein
MVSDRLTAPTWDEVFPGFGWQRGTDGRLSYVWHTDVYLIDAVRHMTGRWSVNEACLQCFTPEPQNQPGVPVR